MMAREHAAGRDPAGVIVTDLDELPPLERRSYLDQVVRALGSEWTELVRGEGRWRAELSLDSFHRALSRCGARRGVEVETTTRIGERRGLKETPERLWARIREETETAPGR